MRRTLHLIYGLIVITFMSACNTAETPPASEPGSDYLYATLWFQRGAEAEANIITQYKLAALMLERALQDPEWTAAPAEQVGDYQNKPPAVILDVDETVLDNSPFAGWLIENDAYYDNDRQADWDRWILSAQCRALPGAIEFIRATEARNVKVFYVTNRPADQQEATRKNLQAVGLNVTDEDIFLKGEQQDWGSDKGSRRKAIADNYRVLLLLGDNLGDFVDGYKSDYDERAKFLDRQQYGHLWGEKWIVFPNPIYGSWEQAAFEYDSTGKTRGEIRKLMKSFLYVWDGK